MESIENIKKRISYIEGMAEGMDFFKNSKEGKFFNELVEVIGNLADSHEHILNRLAELEEYVEAIDEDLNDIEWDFYEDEDEDNLDYEDEILEDLYEDDDEQVNIDETIEYELT